MNHRLRAAAAFVMLALSIILAPVASAAVEVHFYSHDLGTNFPHAFIVVDGMIDATGERVSANYGFTAKVVSPAILLASVHGYVEVLKPDYIAKSDRRFTITLDDSGYARLMAKVAEWQDRKQPNYSLDKRNCVHFVMELAEAAGLKVNRLSKFFKKPRSFLLEVLSLNRGVKQ